MLNEIEWIENYIIEVKTNQLGTDEIIVRVGCQEKYFNSEKKIKDHFRARLRVAPEIKFYNPTENFNQQLPENSRKPITFIDNRNL